MNLQQGHCPNDSAPPTARGLERQRRIIEAAREVFFEQGYDCASISEIISRAGGSMSTLYRQFGNKFGLFRAIMEESSLRVFSALNGSALKSDDPEQALMAFGQVYIDLIASPNAVAMRRLVVAVRGQEKEEVQQLFYSKGPQRALQILEAYLQKQANAGIFDIEDCTIAAAQFLEMVKAPWLSLSEFGVEHDPDLSQRALRQGVKIFLGGVLASK